MLISKLLLNIAVSTVALATVSFGANAEIEHNVSEARTPTNSLSRFSLARSTASVIGLELPEYVAFTFAGDGTSEVTDAHVLNALIEAEEYIREAKVIVDKFNQDSKDRQARKSMRINAFMAELAAMLTVEPSKPVSPESKKLIEAARNLLSDLKKLQDQKAIAEAEMQLLQKKLIQAEENNALAVQEEAAKWQRRAYFGIPLSIVGTAIFWEFIAKKGLELIFSTSK